MASAVRLGQGVDFGATMRTSSVGKFVGRAVCSTFWAIPFTPEQRVNRVQRIQGVRDVEPGVVHKTSMHAAADISTQTTSVYRRSGPVSTAAFRTATIDVFITVLPWQT